MTLVGQRIRERGQSATSYAAMIIVVLALVLAAVGYMTPIGERVGCEITSAVTKLFGGNPSVCGEKPRQYEADPAKVAKTTSETSKTTKAGVAVKAGPGDIKVDGSDGVSSSKTTNYDGSGNRSVKNTIELEGGYEFDSDKRKKKGDAADSSDSGPNNDPFAARLQISGKLSGSRTTSNTWNCDGKGQRTCDDFDKANKDAIEDQTNNHGLGRIGNHHKKVDAEPDSTSVSWNFKLKLNAQGSLSANDKGDKDSSDKGGDGKDDKKAPSAKASLKVGGEVGYTSTETTTKTKKGDEKTSSSRFTYKGELQGSTDLPSAFGLSESTSLGGSYAGSYEVTRDAEGKVKTITFTSVSEGSLSKGLESKIPAGKKSSMKTGPDGKLQGTVTVKTTLDVSSLNDEQRKIAENYVSSSATNGALFVPPSVLNPNSPSDDPFSNLLYEKAQTTRTVQGGTKVTDSGGIDLVVFHWDETTETTSTDTVSVDVLDRPGADGKRNYKDSGLK